MRRSRILLPISCLFLLVVPLAAQDRMGQLEEELGSIQGTLRDASTGREVPDTRVDLMRAGGMVDSAVSDSSGTFLLDSVPTGTYTISVRHPDYLPFSQELRTDGRRVFGLQLQLRKRPAAPGATAGPADPAPEGAPARATGIPRPAQDAMNNGMDLLYVKSDARGSVASFERAVREYPGFYEAYTQIGVARTNLGDEIAAETAFRRAIELSEGKYADAHLGLAVMLSSGKRFADAEAAARRAVELNPGDWRAQGELARALHGLRRFQDAEGPADAAVKLAPDNPILHLLRSSIHLELKNLPAMAEDLDAYLKLVPTGAEADRMRELRAKVQQAIDSAPPAPQSPPPASAPQL